MWELLTWPVMPRKKSTQKRLTSSNWQSFKVCVGGSINPTHAIPIVSSNHLLPLLELTLLSAIQTQLHLCSVHVHYGAEAGILAPQKGEKMQRKIASLPRPTRCRNNGRSTDTQLHNCNRPRPLTSHPYSWTWKDPRWPIRRLNQMHFPKCALEAAISPWFSTILSGNTGQPQYCIICLILDHAQSHPGTHIPTTDSCSHYKRKGEGATTISCQKTDTRGLTNVTKILHFANNLSAFTLSAWWAVSERGDGQAWGTVGDAQRVLMAISGKQVTLVN